jgi:hypothetical protein
MTSVYEVKDAVRPHLHVVSEEERDDVPRVSVEDARRGLSLSNRTKRLLQAKSSKGEDRSARLYELTASLIEDGAEAESAFVLARGSVWNKFRGRDDEVQRLWEAVSRASNNSEGASSLQHHYASPRAATRSVKLSTLLGREVPQSEWCVERIWENKGWGFIAGEPKTYKSTFTCDLAVSLATGTPFLGHFNVAKPGPVLIVQEENTENIQWARLNRILRGRDLGGKFHGLSREGSFEVTFPQTDPEIYCLDRDRFSFTRDKKRRTLEADVKAIQPSLVVLDPIQRMMGDLSIRNEKDVSKVLDWLDNLVQSYKCGVLLVHHYHKRREDGPMEGGQRMLGSQALHAWLSCGLYVQRIDGSRMKVSREFRAFGEQGSFELEFQSEDDKDFYHVEVFEGKRGKRKSQDELLDLIEERPGITVAEAAKMLKVTRQALEQRVVRLQDDILVKRRKQMKGRGRPSRTLWPQGESSDAPLQ